MTQVRTRGMRPSAFCRSKAFRSGYEDCRTGRPPRFGEWGNCDLAYEIGRQAAAFAKGSDLPLRPIPVARRLPPGDIDWLTRLALGVAAIEKPWMRSLYALEMGGAG